MNLNNTAIGIAYSQSFDYWVPDRPLPTDNRRERTLDLSVTQLLSPRQTIQFTYTALRSEGFLAQSTDQIVEFTPPLYAQYPDHRKGSAYAVRFITLLNDPTSLHLLYRYYRDHWHIRSDTVNIELYRDISPSVVLGARYRYYTQSAAFFAKPLESYAPGDTFVAVNYRMYAFHSNTIGAMAITKPSKSFMSGFDADKVKLNTGFAVTLHRLLAEWGEGTSNTEVLRRHLGVIEIHRPVLLDDQDELGVVGHFGRVLRGSETDFSPLLDERGDDHEDDQQDEENITQRNDVRNGLEFFLAACRD